MIRKFKSRTMKFNLSLTCYTFDAMNIDYLSAVLEGNYSFACRTL